MKFNYAMNKTIDGLIFVTDSRRSKRIQNRNGYFLYGNLLEYGHDFRHVLSFDADGWSRRM